MKGLKVVTLLTLLLSCGEVADKAVSRKYLAVDIQVQEKTACADVEQGARRSLVCWGTDPRLNDHPRIRKAQPVGFYDETFEGFAGDCMLGPENKPYCPTSVWEPGKPLVGTAVYDVALSSRLFSHALPPASRGHQCFVDTSSRLHCWGGNASGQIGIGEITPCYNLDIEDMCDGIPTPQPIDLPGEVEEVAVGLLHTCALTNRTLFCWGDASLGAIGHMSALTVSSPTQLMIARRFVSVTASGHATCAVTTDGSVLCWGEGPHSLPVGSPSGLTQPVELEIPEPISSLSMGSTHACAVGESGAIYCWGENAFGELGLGYSGQMMTTPSKVVQLPGEGRVVSVGRHTTCAAMGNGSVFCWGLALYGSVGDGTVGDPEGRRPYPTLVDGF